MKLNVLMIACYVVVAALFVGAYMVLGPAGVAFGVGISAVSVVAGMEILASNAALEDEGSKR